MIRLFPFVLLDASSKGRLQQFEKKFFLYFYVTFWSFFSSKRTKKQNYSLKKKRIMEQLMITVNVAIVFGVIYKLFELFVGRKERMMLIEKLPIEVLKDKRFPLIKFERNCFPYIFNFFTSRLLTNGTWIRPVDRIFYCSRNSA